MKKLAKIFSAALVLLLVAGLFPCTAVFAADSGSTADYNWTFDNGVLTITPIPKYITPIHKIFSWK